jgi:hypothetical protein
MPTIPRRYELSTVGADEANQGLTTDPFLPSTQNPTALGLRVPPVLMGITGVAQPRYLFLLATRTLSRGKTIVRGIRQGLTIGANIAPSGSGRAPLYAEEFLVTSPFWHFVDGNVSWHLVREPAERQAATIPRTNGPSWAYMVSDGPAMLYKTFTNTNVDPTTGAPYYYDVGMSAYAPPNPRSWQPIGNLGNMKDMRSPWNAPTNAIAMDEEVTGTCRISLYASILQSNPATRIVGTLPAAADVYPGGITPESAFLATFPNAIYWRVFGGILFEDIEEDIGR